MRSFLIIFLAVLLYGVVHSILASLRAKALSRQWVGPQADRWYRLLFNVFAFVSLVPILALPVLLPNQPLYSVPAPWRFGMFVVQGLGLMMGAITLLQTDTMSFVGLRQLTHGFDALPHEKLVVSGFYRWVRHPLYTASLLFLWASPDMSFNLFALYLAFTVYFVVGAVYEERKLETQFGEAYTSYKEKTPMLIPGLRWARRKG